MLFFEYNVLTAEMDMVQLNILNKVLACCKMHYYSFIKDVFNIIHHYK
jgi:hypothetical protein